MSTLTLQVVQHVSYIDSRIILPTFLYQFLHMKCFIHIVRTKLYSWRRGAYQNYSLEYPWLLNRLCTDLEWTRGVGWDLGLITKRFFNCKYFFLNRRSISCLYDNWYCYDWLVGWRRFKGHTVIHRVIAEGGATNGSLCHPQQFWCWS